MKIILNGDELETNAQTLDELCNQLGFTTAKIATARNGDFVPKTSRANTQLQDNDRVEIVTPRQGG